MQASIPQFQCTSDACGDDERLVRQAKRDVEAFGKLYDRYYPEISRYIYIRTLDESLTEDLTSNTFYAAFRNIRKYRWKRVPFGAWLYRIALNEIRMNARTKRGQVTVSLQSERRSDIAAVAGLRCAAPTASDTLMASQQSDAIRTAVGALKDDYQAVVTLRFYQEKTIREIALILRKREGTVKSLLHRALQQLRTTLDDESLSATE